MKPSARIHFRNSYRHRKINFVARKTFFSVDLYSVTSIYLTDALIHRPAFTYENPARNAQATIWGARIRGEGGIHRSLPEGHKHPSIVRCFR